MSTSHLPAAIVAATTALASDLSAWASAHPDSDLATQEAAVLGAVRAALPALLHGVLLTTQRTLRTPARCPRCHRRALVRAWRPRQVQTTCGPLRWERPWATCPRCRTSFGVADASLGLAPYQQHSAGVNALLVALGGACAFGEAARLLRLTTGLVSSRETVRRVTEAAGTQHAAAAEARTAAYLAGQEPAVVVPARGTLVVETDGVMVRYQDGWHEAKVGLAGGWVATAQGGGRLRGVSYVAAREESSAFAGRWGAEAARRGAQAVVGWQGAHQGVAVLRPVVVLGDGAKWIWEAAASQFGARTEIVDYYHACEHLTTAAGLLHGVGTPAAQRWARAQRETLLTRGAAAVLPALAVPATLTGDVATALRTEQGYFRSNAARMAYPTFRAQGLPIGSGAVESSAKHVVQQRLKRPGARWSVAGGRALLALRAQQATANGLAA